MNSILYIKKLIFFCLMTVVGLSFSSCSDDDQESVQGRFGFVQFKLFKSASFNKSGSTDANVLQFLGEAEKMKIVLTNNEDGAEVIQTLALNPLGDDAELGLRSEKLQLMEGDYTVVGFYLYKAVGQDLQLILSGEPFEKTVVTVVEGGLTVKDMAVNVVERGSIKLKLVKSMIANKAAGNASNYVFSDVRFATVQVKNQFNGQKFIFTQIPFKYSELLSDQGSVYAVATSDSALSIKAGKYEVVSYILYNKEKKTLDADNVMEEALFEVEDNKPGQVDVPVNIYHSAAYIQDYLALKQIWESLDGPNWSYDDQNFPLGTNWDFNKDIDLWGIQPGVGLDSKGRVVGLNIGSFGPRGIVPAAIGQLTELTILTLGTHSDQIGANMPEQWTGEVNKQQKQEWRNDYYNRFIKKDLRNTFSEPLQLAFEMNGNGVTKAAALQSGMAKSDVVPGNLTNGIRGISKEISKLTKLQQLFIANGHFVDFEEGTDFSLMEDLTDVELYNCPSMKSLPAALFTMRNIELLNLACNPQIESSVFEAGLELLAQSPTADKLQILYLRNNKLITLPESFRNFKALGKLDCAYNQLQRIPALGKEISLVQLNMEYNQISEIPNINGYFCGFEDMENFTFSHNKLKLLPNIFDAEAIFGMTSVDFSFNEIEGVEDGDAYRGIYVTTLSLAGNKLKEFPSVLFNKNSNVKSLVLSGNGMEKFADGSLKGKNTYFLESLDLTYNKLSKLPNEFNAVTLPYLYGIDMSNNRFADFPYGPLNVARLTVFALRNQRDANGNRIMREWPTGIYTCIGLRALYLGGNDLRKIDDKISSNIYIFEIKDNPNISIDVSAVCAYIRNGYYRLIYDRTQDIRGCDYLNLE